MVPTDPTSNMQAGSVRMASASEEGFQEQKWELAVVPGGPFQGLWSVVRGKGAGGGGV